MPKNKVKYNLKNVHVAKQSKSDAGVYTYATPVHIPGAVSLSLSAEGSVTPMYADGVIYFRSTANNGYSGDLEMALIPDWFRRDILNEMLDDNGVLVENSNENETIYFALLFEFDGDQKAIRHVMYNCSVSSRPTVESETKNDTIEPGTETLSLSADPRDDGLVKARSGDDTDSATYNNWYGSVYIPSVTGNVPVSGISLDEVTATVAAGDTVTLTATIAPSNATNQNVSWSSSDETKATVANGVVTGVAEGSATITVTAASDSTKTATCVVTVTANG